MFPDSFTVNTILCVLLKRHSFIDRLIHSPRYLNFPFRTIYSIRVSNLFQIRLAATNSKTFNPAFPAVISAILLLLSLFLSTWLYHPRKSGSSSRSLRICCELFLLQIFSISDDFSINSHSWMEEAINHHAAVMFFLS